jgi:cystathionine gamma-synthase
MSKSQQHTSSLVATAGINEDTAFGAIISPLYLSANYSLETYGKKRDYDYSRTANPTRDQLANLLVKLEGGADALVLATGMAAIDLVLQPLKNGARVVAPHDCYGGTHRLLQARHKQGHIIVEWVDQNSEEALTRAFSRPADLVFIETPSNPLMRIVDIASIASLAKAAGAKVCVDNTFLTPVLQTPIVFGADYVVHSTTKYLNGHSDIVGGAIVTAHAEDGVLLKWWANCTGVTGSPFDAYMTLRGARTLFVRLERQQASAAKIANYLNSHPAVSAVYYPGLTRHPGHTIAKRQQKGFGAMLSLELADGSEAVRQFIDALKIFTLAQSLGGIESLIAHPASMTHAGMPPEARAVAGIKDNLLRLSIGLEHEEDLISDLDSALAACTHAYPIKKQAGTASLPY